MKHCFTSDGRLAYRPALAGFKEKLVEALREVKTFSACRVLVLTTAATLIHDQQIEKALGLGGNNVPFADQPTASPLAAALKEVFLDFLRAGHVPQEFYLVAYSALGGPLSEPGCTGARKHYYDEDGILNYTVSDRSLLVALAQALEPLSDDSLRAARPQVMKAADGLLADLQIEAERGRTDYRAPVEASEGCDAVCCALGALFNDFLDQGYLPQEFVLAAWSALMEIHFTWCLSGTEGQSEKGEVHV